MAPPDPHQAVVISKLREIDRSDVRGFTVAMGQEFHGCVAGDPETGAPWAECEEMRYSFAHLHHERFGAFPGTGSGISRESGQNLTGRPH